MKNFCICDGKGFQVTFENGWCVSVQFGRGNYADNYNLPSMGEDFRDSNRKAGEKGSNTAECAAINPAGDLVELPAFMFDSDDFRNEVSNRSTPAQVLELMNWAAQQPKEPA